MDNVINLLPDNIANQIAAGEVIQRPASVIKELVENSIDAGASEVIIEIKQAGKTLIQVIDNGKGMAPMDARMAFERHATSKIKAAEDLFALTTMGFRGEALASIAAVAQVVLQTRPHGVDMGTRVEIEGSKVLSSSPVICAPGANFAIRNLFFNIPARRRFLKGDDTEFKHILTETQRVAAVYPEIQFVLRHNDQLVLDLQASTLKQRVIDLFGNRLIDILLSLDVDTPLVRISGFVSRASSSRKRGALQYFFVNGRYMKHIYFHRAVMNAYEAMIPLGEQPEYFLYLEVDPARIDVNIHPTKTEIKFEAEGDISKIIYSAVREVLMKGAAVPSIDFDIDNPIDLPTFTPVSVSDMMEPSIISSRINSTFSSSFLSGHSIESQWDTLTDIPQEYQLPDMSDWDEFYRNFEANRTSAPPSSNPPKQSFIIESSALQPSPSTVTDSSGKEDYVTFRGYALVSMPTDLYMIHLRRGYARRVYDDYMSMLGQDNLISNRLLFPQLVELGVKEARLLAEHLSALQSVGFDISDMGSRSYAINAIPCGLPAGDEAALLLDILGECSAFDRSSKEVVSHKLVLALTQYRMKNEDTLSAEDTVTWVLGLIKRGDALPLSPDGKIIVSLLTPKELAKRFGE